MLNSLILLITTLNLILEQSLGIMDPTKVCKTSLVDAFSVAGLLMTTEAMIADDVEDPPKIPPGMGGGMGGMPGMM